MGLKEILQGKWLGHPLHPALVHVAVGLWPAALVFDLVGWAAEGQVWVQISFFAILLGLLAAAVAIPPGLADWSGIKREKPAWKLGLIHMVINGVGYVIWLVNLILRLPDLQTAQRATGLQVALSLAGTAALLIGAWFGGRMVFDQGTSVARLSKKKWRKRAEAGNAALPEK